MPKPPTEFSTIAPRITLYRAPPVPSPSAPSIVVLCTWMNAAEKHVALYAQRYRELFPLSSLLIVRASVADVVSTSAAKTVARLGPAVAAFEAITSDARARTTGGGGGGEGGAVLHAFSNGGGLMAVELSMLLQQEREKAKGKDGIGAAKKGFEKVILDCTPSKPNVGEAARATVVGVPKIWVLQVFAELVARFFYIAWRVLDLVLGRENGLLRLRRKLNEPGLLTEGKGDRLYLYSESDRMVGWRDIREHGEDARREGVAGVEEVRFKKAAHCALAVEDYDRYWGAVERFFKS